MRSLLWHFCFFFSVQGSQQQHCGNACARSARKSFSMDLYPLRQSYPEVRLESRPHWPQAPMLQETKCERRSIPGSYTFVRPTNSAPQYHALDLYHSQQPILQGQNDQIGQIQRHPAHFAEPGIDNCELIPVICWLGYVRSPSPPSALNLPPRARGSETNAAPIYECCSMLPIGCSQDRTQIRDPDAEALPNSDPLGPTNIAPPDTLQANLDRAPDKSPYGIPKRQFKCTHPGCDRQFKRRAALERHLTCHSDERPYICWVPECHRAFKRFDNLSAHYLTHGKMGGRSRYVATLDKACYFYDPGFRGKLTPQGWPLPNVLGERLDERPQ